MRKKHEYQKIDSADYTKRPLTRIVLGILLLVQMLVLLLWVITLIERSRNAGSYSDAEKSTFQPEDLMIEAEIFEDYQRESLIRDGKDPEAKCSVTRDAEKFDCHPESEGNQESCSKRRCCWEVVEAPGVPWCYFPKKYGGYETVNATLAENGYTAFMSRTFPSPYPEDVKLLRLDVNNLGANIIYLKLVDAESHRYEPPYPQIPVVLENNSKERTLQLKFSPNGFKVLNRGQVLFDTEDGPPLIYTNQFLQVSMPFTGKIYGLGEHHTSLELDTNWTKYTLFNRDGIPEPGKNLYGSHPFFLSMTPDGRSQGVFLHNSNAMDIILQPLPAVTYRTIGGVIDLYFFAGPTPGDVIKQYTSLIGRSFMPPYWSLGFHLSRFGYKTTFDLKRAWERTRQAKIPLDVMWSDIDYMDKRNDFTLDKANFGDLPRFVKKMHASGVHYIPILDPGIGGCEPNGTYHPYDEGVKMDVFVKHENGSIFVGKVWNRNCTVFPDFTSNTTHVYWSGLIRKFHKLLPFDGLWLDMNEPSNFLDGSFDSCPPSKWDNPPFTPNVVGGKLRHLTLCMSARHAAGLHYDVHNVYGLAEAIATNKALKRLGKRPFIISRSTYPGVGRYAGHWSGDVTSTWESMKATIPKMLSFSLFGVPMMGADICGFNGNTTVLLCLRWSQLGAFYPFSRNHNSDDCIDQDPVALGIEVVKSTQKALLTRYTLLPYLYTLFFKAHTQGETVARPLFFEFPSDPHTHSLDESFLWGCCLLIVPVLKESATTVKTYLPAARWYDWYTGLGLESSGMEIVLSAPSDTIPILIRGGVILPTQRPGLTTTKSRKNPIELIAACNTSLDASGSFYWDDGRSLDTYKTGQYGLVNFTLTPNNLTSHVSYWGYSNSPKVDSIKILGFVKPIKKVHFNNRSVPFHWNTTSLILTVRVYHSINVAFTLEWNDFEV